MSDIPTTDLIVIAEKEVISKAKAWAEYVKRDAPFLNGQEINLFTAVTLLESREKDTERLEGK